MTPGQPWGGPARDGGRVPSRDSGGTRPPALDQWRKALAAHNRAKRNQRGRRNRDPYRRTAGIRRNPKEDR